MDPIADFITQIKNASDAGKESVTIPYSKMKEDILSSS
jgi:ribosomal protein S8